MPAMRSVVIGLCALGALSLSACGSSSSGTTTTNQLTTGSASSGAGTGGSGGGAGGGGGAAPVCNDAGASGGGVPHVIIVVQENHTFDGHFGGYCTAAPGSNPTCTSGPACCEAAPATEPSGASPVKLDDTEMAGFDPNHTQVCEVDELDQGKMDHFVTSTVSGCGSAHNFAISDATIIKPYHDLAAQYAIADRYFQPIAGQSSSNDMYLAVAKEVFIDNAFVPDTTGRACSLGAQPKRIEGEKTIADILQTAGKRVAWYAEGYDDQVKAGTDNCPSAEPGCGFNLPVYPCTYSNGDVPFLYYAQHADDPKFMADYTQLAKDLAGGTLPDVSYVKAIGFRGEHPGYGTKLSDGVKFVTDLVNTVEKSCYANNTLILVTWDEGGGYFDHVAPPPTSTVDNQPYGTRIPLIAIGRYAKKGEVSHVTMEHSSIVKFLEYNYTGQTGQLGARDAVVNNIGSLLDPAETGVTIPDQ